MHLCFLNGTSRPSPWQRGVLHVHGRSPALRVLSKCCKYTISISQVRKSRLQKILEGVPGHCVGEKQSGAGNSLFIPQSLLSSPTPTLEFVRIRSHRFSTFLALPKCRAAPDSCTLHKAHCSGVCFSDSSLAWPNTLTPIHLSGLRLL